jgi:hypothetical protein
MTRRQVMQRFDDAKNCILHHVKDQDVVQTTYTKEASTEVSYSRTALTIFSPEKVRALKEITIPYEDIFKIELEN